GALEGRGPAGRGGPRGGRGGGGPGFERVVEEAGAAEQAGALGAGVGRDRVGGHGRHDAGLQHRVFFADQRVLPAHGAGHRGRDAQVVPGVCGHRRGRVSVQHAAELLLQPHGPPPGQARARAHDDGAAAPGNRVVRQGGQRQRRAHQQAVHRRAGGQGPVRRLHGAHHPEPGHLRGRIHPGLHLRLEDDAGHHLDGARHHHLRLVLHLVHGQGQLGGELVLCADQPDRQRGLLLHPHRGRLRHGGAHRRALRAPAGPAHAPGAVPRHRGWPGPGHVHLHHLRRLLARLLLRRRAGQRGRVHLPGLPPRLLHHRDGRLWRGAGPDVLPRRGQGQGRHAARLRHHRPPAAHRRGGGRRRAPGRRAGPHPARRRHLCLPPAPRGPGLRRLHARRARRHDRRAGGRVRQRQVHGGRPGGALLRPRRRRRAPGWRGPAAAQPALAAVAAQPGGPGAGAVQHDHLGEHPLRPPRRLHGRGRGRRGRRQRARVRGQAARGIPHQDRRRRHPPVGRPEAAHRHRPRRLARPKGPPAGRGDLGARRRERARRAGRPRPHHARPHHARHRAPALHHPRRRPDIRRAPGSNRRAGHPRRTHAAGGSLRPPRGA
ncbi:hypothetical protein H632_c2470p0, partial [Helicosporidium sp. ATCC 50920]